MATTETYTEFNSKSSEVASPKKRYSLKTKTENGQKLYQYSKQENGKTVKGPWKASEKNAKNSLIEKPKTQAKKLKAQTKIKDLEGAEYGDISGGKALEKSKKKKEKTPQKAKILAENLQPTWPSVNPKEKLEQIRENRKEDKDRRKQGIVEKLLKSKKPETDSNPLSLPPISEIKTLEETGQGKQKIQHSYPQLSSAPRPQSKQVDQEKIKEEGGLLQKSLQSIGNDALGSKYKSDPNFSTNFPPPRGTVEREIWDAENQRRLEEGDAKRLADAKDQARLESDMPTEEQAAANPRTVIDNQEHDPNKAPGIMSYEDVQKSRTGSVVPGDNYLEQSNFPQSEDEAKYEEGAETTMMNLDAPESQLLEEQTLRKEPPERMEAINLQKEAVKSPAAKKELSNMFGQIKNPQARAEAKEELGNYYIDPVSGFAINLEELNSQPDRAKKMRMLEHFPAHLRPHAMANMGLLDPDDIPVDFKHELEKAKLAHEMSKFSAEHGEGKRQFNLSNKFRNRKLDEQTKLKGRELTLAEKEQLEMSADREFKSAWDSINNLLGEDQYAAAAKLSKANGFEMEFDLDTVLEKQNIELLKDLGKNSLTKHPMGKDGVKKYLDYAKDVQLKLIAPRGDGETGYTYFDKALIRADIKPYMDSGSKLSEAEYNSLHFEEAYMAMMMGSPHSSYHEKVTDYNTRKALNTGKITNTDTGNNTGTGGNKGDDGNKTGVQFDTSKSEIQDPVEGSGFMEGESDAELALGAGISTDLNAAMSDNERNTLSELQGRLKQRREKDASYKEEQGSVTSPYAILNFLDEMYTKYSLQPPSKRQQARLKEKE